MIDFLKVKSLKLNPPIGTDEIETLEIEMKVSLPKVYKDLLKSANGISIGGGLIIYGTMDILERNLTWEVAEYAEGYVAIGDDGGGDVFLMYQDSEAKDVIIVDSGDMNPNNARKVTSDFTSWVSNGCEIKSEVKNKTQLSLDICDLVLVNMPSGGTKDLLQIKNTIGIQTSMGEILKGSKNLPFILEKGFPYGKAIKLVEKLGTMGNAIKIVPSNMNK